MARWSPPSVRPPFRFSGACSPVEGRRLAALWGVALLTYGVGDVATTFIITRFSDRVTEANLLVATVVREFGGAGLVGLKLAVFGLCLAASLDAARREDSFGTHLPPAVLAVVGVAVTAVNLGLLLG